MRSITEKRPGINPGPDRGAPAPRRPVDPHQLDPAARRAFEESLKATPGLKGRSMLVLLVLLDIARGKPWGYPSDGYVAGKSGVSPNTVWRALRDLVDLGLIRIVKARGRRWIILIGHPFAEAFLAGLEPAAGPAEPPAPIASDPSPGPERQDGIPAPQVETTGPQDGGRIVLVNRASEARDPACAEAPPPTTGRPEESPSRLNEPTTVGPPVPRPAGMTSRRISMIPDLAGAPAADPIIAAELARRACARESAAAIPARDEVLAAVLGDAAGDAPGAGPAPEGHRVGPGVHDAAPALDPEAATIEALSRLGPGATRADVLVATARLANLFGDPGSRAYYRGVVNNVVRGQLPARVPIAAVGYARGPDIKSPARAFVGHIKRCEAAAEARRSTGGG